jgi:hypothetical protein
MKDTKKYKFIKMKQVVIECSTNWAGMKDETHLYIPDDMLLDDPKLEEYARGLAVENAESYDIVNLIAQELFEEDEEGNFSEAEMDEAYERLEEYIDYDISYFDEENPNAYTWEVFTGK